jgi:hypothetical protein
VPLLVTGLAQPDNLKRFIVIFVMSDCLSFSASATGLSNQPSITDGSGDTGMSHLSSQIFCSPCAVNFCCRLDALWLFATRLVIGPYPFNIFSPIGCDIIFVALLAFVDVSVKHSRVFVKVLQRLDGIALKTTFRTSHVELQ